MNCRNHREAFLGDLIPSGSEEHKKQVDSYRSASCCRCSDLSDRLFRNLEIFLMVEPDPGHDYAMGCGILSPEKRKEHDALRRTCHIHVSRHHDLLHGGSGMYRNALEQAGSRDECLLSRCRSDRNCLCRSLPVAFHQENRKRNKDDRIKEKAAYGSRRSATPPSLKTLHRSLFSSFRLPSQ